MDATGGRGVDYAFEAAGIAELVTAGVAATRVGGTTVMVGASPIEDPVVIPNAVLFTTLQKRLIGSLLGGCWPNHDIPFLVNLWRRGELDLEALISARVSLQDVNPGIDRLRTGEGVRTVVDLVEA